MSEDRSKDSGGMFTHAPLPYIVRIRVVVDDDATPESREFKLTAYSVLEAMMQALYQAGGTAIDGVNYKVEDIRPDIAEYYRMIATATADAVAMRRTL